MATFSLDDIRSAADAKYGSTDIQIDDKTTVVLRNPLRLSKAERDELGSLQDKLDGDDAIDQADVLADAIRLVAKDKKIAEKLIEQIDGDLALLAQVFSTYSKGTQAGKPKPRAPHRRVRRGPLPRPPSLLRDQPRGRDRRPGPLAGPRPPHGAEAA